MLNYLSHRYQYVEYNGVQSSSQHINTGVPQGSILGPLLFLLYINDLPLVSPVFRMLMYADDTTLFCNINNDINDNEINRQLNTINEWLLSNKLSLNIKKTKYMVFHTNQGWPVAFTGGICHRYIPVNTGVDNTPKSGIYRHLLAFINISLISLQITLLTVLATYYIIHGHHSAIFAAYA